MVLAIRLNTIGESLMPNLSAPTLMVVHQPRGRYYNPAKPGRKTLPAGAPSWAFATSR